MSVNHVEGWESVGEVLSRLSVTQKSPARRRGWNPPDPRIMGFALAGSLWVGAIVTGLIPAGTDAVNFYAHLSNPYAVTEYASGQGFYYAPPVALAMQLVRPLGLPVFAALISGLGLLALGWIGRRWAWLLLFFPPVWWDIAGGNVNTIIGAAAVAMIARPGWVAVPLLTKVTPAVIGLWWIVRREWGEAGRAIVVTVLLCVPSLVLTPHWWGAWILSLASNGTGYTGPGYFTIPVPLLPRLALAAILVAWGAHTNRRWTLPAAACVALPVLWWSGLAVAVGLIPRPRSEAR